MTEVPSLLTNAPIGFGAGGPLPAPSPWTSFGTYIRYGNGGVVIGDPAGGSFGPGTLNAVNLLINGISINPNNWLPLTGGTIVGNLAINGNFSIIAPGTVDGSILDMGTY